MARLSKRDAESLGLVLDDDGAVAERLLEVLGRYLDPVTCAAVQGALGRCVEPASELAALAIEVRDVSTIVAAILEGTLPRAEEPRG